MGEKVTYAEHRKRQRDYERRVWDSLTPDEQTLRWAQRELYLWTEHVRLRNQLPHHIHRVSACLSCRAVKPEWTTGWPRGWPSHYQCQCGVVSILDVWLPDQIERITMKDPVDLEQFVRTGPRLDNLFDYPLADRIKDLRGRR
jgi:hypothetical protein